MSEIIRIPNIENYVQEIVNGELILTPKHLFTNESNDDCINQQSARNIVLAYRFNVQQSKAYESQIIDNCLNNENEETRDFLKRQVGLIHQVKIGLKKQFVETYGEKLWDNMMIEYGL
jgi:hypothetical protein